MLLSLLFRGQAFALILGIVFLFLSDYVTSVSVSTYITDIVAGGNEKFLEFITGLALGGIIRSIEIYLYNPRPFIAPISPGFEVFKLALYVAIFIVISYIIFLKSDIA